jgi:hypothetical protein
MKKMRCHCQDNLFPGCEFNPGTPEYEAELLTTRQRLSVRLHSTLVMKAICSSGTPTDSQGSTRRNNPDGPPYSHSR